MIPNILQKIVETKKTEVASAKKYLKDFQYQADDNIPALDFKNALKKDTLAIIAEIKKASPSAGIISPNFNPAEVANAYYAGNVNAVSVLTDREYFKGSPEYIKTVRPILKNIPILRKDFIINPVQIYEARALGADTFLLISAILTLSEMKEFIDIGRSLGMEPLVESHSEEELIKTISSSAIIMGVNNRDLRNFTVDLSSSENLRKIMPEYAISVAESGINNKEDSLRLKKAEFDAILVGESLMRSGIEKCSEKIKELTLMD